MLKRIFVLFIALGLFLSSPVLAIKAKKVEIEATHILVGKVKKVESYYDVNDWGDVLILSQVKVKVERKVKGKMEDSVSFVVEGGTVGDMTLKVSEYPLFIEGEKVMLHLKEINYFFHFVKSEKLEAARGKGKPPKKPKGDGEKCCKTFAHWPDPNVPYYINPDNDDISKDNCVNGDIIAGAASWNSESNINLNYAGTTGTKIVEQNFTNEIFFRDAKSGSTIAATYVWYYRKGRRIIEFDMVFYDGAWKFSSLTSSKCKDSCDGGFYVQTIGTHELGHAIGIDHNRCKTSIMYPYAGFCDENTVLSADDKACVSNLYK